MAKSYLGLKGVPRGIANNNPGNLRITTIAWQGKIPVAQNTDKAYEQFKNLTYGLRAMATDITNDVAAGADTLRKLITQYAPPSENNTQTYISYVSQETGIKPDEKLQLTADALANIMYAKLKMENGATLLPKYITLADIKEGIDAMADSVKKKLYKVPALA